LITEALAEWNLKKKRSVLSVTGTNEKNALWHENYSRQNLRQIEYCSYGADSRSVTARNPKNRLHFV
jgi:hypothetical protein